MVNVCVLGATGSVGGAALEVIGRYAPRFRAACLVGGGNAVAMAALCRRYRPDLAVLADEGGARELAVELAGEGIEVAGGEEAVLAAAADAGCGVVVAAIAGARGVRPVLAAAAAGKRILLANKEALIVAGELLMGAVADGGGELLPIDSEHCALFELLAGDADYQKLWLTASGGSVRELPMEELARVTPAMALAHPNWSMGPKITVDSATMMNKALEILEAAVLFGAPADKIGVVLHPQSVCHALVAYADGALHAGWSVPDMRLPIARMLAHPERLAEVTPALDWQALSEATFAPPCEGRYPCLGLAYRVLELGGGAPAALSAANEVAVARFLAGEIAFGDIARINCGMVDYLCGGGSGGGEVGGLDDIWALDAEARRLAAREVVCWR